LIKNSNRLELTPSACNSRSWICSKTTTFKANANLDFLNQGLSAGLPGIAAQSQSYQNKANLENQTLESNVAARNDSNSMGMQDNSAKRDERVFDVLSSAADKMSDIPPLARMGYLRQVFKERGYDQSPAAQQLLNGLAQGDPNNLETQLTGMVRQHGVNQSAADPKGINARGVAQIAGQFRSDIGAGHDEASRYATDQRDAAAQLRQLKAKSLVEQTASDLSKAAGDPVKVYTILSDASKQAEQSGDMELALKLAQRASEAKPASDMKLTQVKPNTPNLPGMGIDTLPTVALPDPSARFNNGKVAPAAGGIGDAAKAAFGSFEPDKFQYRMSPEGKLQRKAK
jgi:hypothetical protein